MRSGRGSVGVLSFVLLIAGLGGGFLVFVLQAVRWLQTEIWTSVSVVTALQWLHVRWAFLPNDWYGLHQLLDKLPLAIVLPVVGLISALAVSSHD